MSRADIARAGVIRSKKDAASFEYLADCWRGHSEAESDSRVARIVADISEAYGHLNTRMEALRCHFERLAEAVDGEERDYG